MPAGIFDYKAIKEALDKRMGTGKPAEEHVAGQENTAWLLNQGAQIPQYAIDALNSRIREWPGVKPWNAPRVSNLPGPETDLTEKTLEGMIEYMRAMPHMAADPPRIYAVTSGTDPDVMQLRGPIFGAEHASAKIEAMAYAAYLRWVGAHSNICPREKFIEGERASPFWTEVVRTALKAGHEFDAPSFGLK